MIVTGTTALVLISYVEKKFSGSFAFEGNLTIIECLKRYSSK